MCRAVDARDQSPAQSHVCTSNDGCFFRLMADHIAGLLLTARSELHVILREVPSMVRLAHFIVSVQCMRLLLAATLCCFAVHCF